MNMRIRFKPKFLAEAHPGRREVRGSGTRTLLSAVITKDEHGCAKATPADKSVRVPPYGHLTATVTLRFAA
jgi:hypothetical protein